MTTLISPDEPVQQDHPKFREGLKKHLIMHAENGRPEVPFRRFVRSPMGKVLTDGKRGLRQDSGSSDVDGLCWQNAYYGTERICNMLDLRIRFYRTEPIPLGGLDGAKLRNRTNSRGPVYL
jgi:hypothetical protein